MTGGKVLSCMWDLVLPDQRLEDVPRDPDKVGRMDDIQRLQVLLVPAKMPSDVLLFICDQQKMKVCTADSCADCFLLFSVLMLS